MAKLNTFGKILIAVIILFIPFVIIYSSDTISNRIGLCIQDICPDDFEVANSCLVATATECTYILGTQIKLTETEAEDKWRITGTDVACFEDVQILSEPIDGVTEKTNIFCENFAFFDKDDWDRIEGTTPSGQTATKFTRK